MTTPYTHSRARVLTRYLVLRHQGMNPPIAMDTVLADLNRQLKRGWLLPDREQAEVEWDKAHATRYWGAIEQRRIHGTPKQRSFWLTGHLWDWDLYND